MILIVRHGPGRGRDPNFLSYMLEEIARVAPDVYGRLRFHETGRRPPSLDGVTVVLFWLGDPLREFYPACYEEAVAIADRARAKGCHVANPPEALSNTIKTVQSKLWLDAGIDTPEWIPLPDAKALKTYLAAQKEPVLIRADQHHGQKNLGLISPGKRLSKRFVAGLSWPLTATEPIDIRAAYRTAGDTGPFARRHHVMRALVMGPTVRIDHVFFCDDLIVNQKWSSFMLAMRPRRAWRRFKFRIPGVREDIDADLAARGAGIEDGDLMVGALEALGLEFGAVDFARGPDGRTVLWEANPYFYIPTPEGLGLWEQRRTIEKHTLIRSQFIVYFRWLLKDLRRRGGQA